MIKLCICMFFISAPPYTTFKERRKWKPKLLRKQVSESSNSDDEQISGPVRYGMIAFCR